MTPNQSSIWGLNIDQMLQNLSVQPQTTQNIAIEHIIPQDVIWSNIVVESQPQQSNSLVSSLSTSNNNFFWSSHTVKTIASICATIILIVVWWFVFVQQYPIETEQIVTKTLWVFSSVLSTTQKNMQSDEIIVNNIVNSWQEIHDVAPENYITESPLSDAIAHSQSNVVQDGSTQKPFDSIMNSDDSFLLSWSIDLTGINNTNWSLWDTSLLPVNQSPTKEQLQQKLLHLSQWAEESMMSFVGSNDSKLWVMRVIYKKSQSLLLQLSDNTVVLDTWYIDQIEQLETIYEKTLL
jgi:hypothetical protein